MNEHESQVVRIVSETPWLADALEVLSSSGIPESYIAAGAIRNTVWDALFGPSRRRTKSDVDVVYFDEATSTRDWRAVLQRERPKINWEVTNQAFVHEWQSRSLGRPVRPYSSLSEAIGTWPETATAIAVRLTPAGQFEILAPCGLDDLMGGVVRSNPETPDQQAFFRRCKGQEWNRRWPQLTVLDCFRQRKVPDCLREEFSA